MSTFTGTITHDGQPFASDVPIHFELLEPTDWRAKVVLPYFPTLSRELLRSDKFAVDGLPGPMALDRVTFAETGWAFSFKGSGKPPAA